MFNDRKQYNKMFKDDEPKLEGVNTDITVCDEREETPTPPAPKKQLKATVVNCKRLNVRNDPDAKSNVVEVLDAGSELTIDDVENGWVKVQTESGVAGYVMDKFIM